MAQIRVSFSTALFGLSFVVCLLVALLFVDRSRQEADENASAQAKSATTVAPVTRESALLGSPVGASTALEHPASQTINVAPAEPPKLVLSGATATTAATPQTIAASPAVAAGAELPIDPRMAMPAPTAAVQTPALTAAQAAALSPQALARQMQGRVVVPGSLAGAAPEMAVPAGMPYNRTAAATPAPRYNAAVPTKTPLPIVTNMGGVAGAMKQMPFGNAYSAAGGISSRPSDQNSPFGQAGVISTQRLRSALAANADLDPSTLLPNDPVASATPAGPMTNAPDGWKQTQQNASALSATPTPNTTIMLKGGQLQSPPQAAASAAMPALAMQAQAPPPAAGTAGMLPPPPHGVDPLAGVMTNDPAVPSPTPNYENGVGSGPAQPAGIGKWNLPPPPSLPGAAVRSGQPKSASPDPAKLTLLPIDDTPAKPLTKDVPKSGVGASTPPAGVGDLPMDIAAKAGMLDAAVAAKVNDRTLSGADAARRADALAALDGRTLDPDGKRMMTRNAAENWAEIVSVAEEAKRQGVTVTQDEVKSILAKNPALKTDEWQTAMKKAGFTDNEIEADARDIALGEKMVQTALAKSYDETKMRAIYDKDPATFTPARKFHVQEIFKARPADAAAAKNIENELAKLQRQAASGTDFGFLAMQSSDAPTKSKGGDLGWLDDKSNITEQMAQALLPLKSGQVTNVVTDARGYHIYKLVELQEPKPGYEGARDLVERGLHNIIYQSAVETAQANQNIELGHQKSKRAIADNSDGKSNGKASVTKGGQSINDIFLESKRSRSSRSENGRARVRSRKDQQDDSEVASNSSRGSDSTAVSPQPPTSSSSDNNKQADAPPGFGGSDANPTLPATPNPATASATGSRPKNVFSNILSKFHRPGSNEQQ